VSDSRRLASAARSARGIIQRDKEGVVKLVELVGLGASTVLPAGSWDLHTKSQLIG
jgi:hypothetical protein